MNYWIKSNTGDYVGERNGIYELNIIERQYGQEKVLGIEVNMNINQVVKDWNQQEY